MQPQIRRVLSSLACAAFLAAPISSASAQVTASGYIADSFTQFAPFSNDLGQYNATLPGTIQRSVSFDSFGPNAPSRHATSTAGGGPGFVNGYTYAQYISNDSSNANGNAYYIQSSSNAEATWSDIVVSGPAGAATVPFSINFVIHGSFLFSCSTVVDPFHVGWQNYSSASFSLRINGAAVASGNWGVRSDSSGPVVNPLGNGVFTNFTGNFAAASDTIMVPVNTPFSISMFLQTNAQIIMPSGGSLNIATATDFAHTANISTTGPAFNLPAGYTVNSAQASVIDNTFTLVPAPAALPALLLAGLFASRRRR